MTTIGELFGDRIATVVPEVVGSALAGELRARFEHAGYARYALLDRGSYHELRAPDEPALVTTLAGLASEATGRALVVAEARVLRLGPGDYLLAHHDRLHADHPVELVLDLSPAAVAGAEVHYRRRGQVYFRFASTPGALAIIERGPTVSCNHTYVSKRHAGASIVRLVLLLRAARSRGVPC
jgi:hypothetical protein